MFNPFRKQLVGTDLILIPLIAVLSVIILFSLNLTSWAAIIHCSATPRECNGTSGDDRISGHVTTINVIHGLGGNDYIWASGTEVIYGDDGNDILIGDTGNDYLNGGTGNDKMDGRYGDDSIVDVGITEGVLVSNDDIISGGEGDDFIFSYFGFDRIQGGPGNDLIYPDGYHRDFSSDIVNCGSGTGDEIKTFYSGDGDTATNCEFVKDFDR